MKQGRPRKEKKEEDFRKKKNGKKKIKESYQKELKKNTYKLRK